MNEQKLKSATIGNVNVISILKKTDMKKRLNGNSGIEEQSKSLIEEDTDFDDGGDIRDCFHIKN